MFRPLERMQIQISTNCVQPFRRRRTQNKKKKIPLCLFVLLFLLHYLCMYCYILSIAKVKTSSFLVCSCKKSERDTVSCVINNEKTKY